MNYGKKTPRTSIKKYFQSFCKIRKIPSPIGAGEELQGGQEAPWRGPTSWPRREPSWLPRTPSPTPPRLRTFLLLQKFLLYICPDRPDNLSRNLVCFISLSVSARKTFSRFRCHGFSKFPQGQVHRQRHQPLPRRGEEAPQVFHVEDGVLRKEDLKGPVKEGSTEERLKEMEHEVFKYKKVVERNVEDNFDVMNELKAFHKKYMKEMLSSLAALEDKIYEIQAQIYDPQNQNCEYELKFSRMSSSTESRVLETEAFVKTGEPLPWKDYIKNYQNNINKEQAKWE